MWTDSTLPERTRPTLKGGRRGRGRKVVSGERKRLNIQLLHSGKLLAHHSWTAQAVQTPSWTVGCGDTLSRWVGGLWKLVKRLLQPGSITPGDFRLHGSCLLSASMEEMWLFLLLRMSSSCVTVQGPIQACKELGPSNTL